MADVVVGCMGQRFPNISSDKDSFDTEEGFLLEVIHGLNTVRLLPVPISAKRNINSLPDLERFVKTSSELGKPIIGVSIKSVPPTQTHIHPLTDPAIVSVSSVSSPQNHMIYQGITR